ncbi:MAG: histidine phosphatase family protein [Lewinellaceae bacterium]|nr:histidine phosphatase family protein [Lewinellaceae bacterium]
MPKVLRADAFLLLLLLALAGCKPPRMGHIRPVSVESIAPGYITFNNGETVRMPFAGRQNTTFIFLVRHAEKGFGADPSLTFQGVKRAKLLAKIFYGLPLDAVFATDYKRTRETAQPVASEKGLEVDQYAPDRLTTFSIRLRRKYEGKNVLVVGHSDTTPELVNRLVTNGVLGRIDERDYSNFYVVAISEEGEKEVMQLKYGEVWVE